MPAVCLVCTDSKEQHNRQGCWPEALTVLQSHGGDAKESLPITTALYRVHWCYEYQTYSAAPLSLEEDHLPALSSAVLVFVPVSSPGLDKPFELSQPNLVVITMIKWQDNINKAAEDDELKISMKMLSIPK